MIILTLDLDWAPDYILEDSFKLLDEYGIKTTLFATHDSPAIRNVANTHEVGIHPDLRNIQKTDESIKELKNIYPDARCIRNHCLVHSSRFLQIYENNGLSITSNYLMLNQDVSGPIPMPHGIHEYPIFFMDDACVLTENSFSSQSLMKNINKGNGLKVITFHPVHIYLNSIKMADYENVKYFLKDKKRTDVFINRGSGVRTIFKALLPEISGERAAGYFPRG